MIARASRWAALAAGALLLAGAQALAQGQPVRIIYPFAAGSAGDGLIRMLAEELRKELNETVIVDNRVGADGRIGVRAVVSAEPDGRTLLLTPFGPIVTHPSVYPNLPYDPLKDLAPVSQVAELEFALSTGPMTNAATLKDAVAWLAANRDKAAFGSPGAGTIPHFSGILFANAAGVELRHAPYRGIAPALNDLAAGQIPLASTPTADVVALHTAGKIRALAITGAKRSPYLPDVPTYKELGYDIEAVGWYALYAPAGTPHPIIERYSAVFSRAVRSEAGRTLSERLSITPTGTGPDELARIQRADFERWAAPIKASGFKPTD
ncbi:MAG: hypothetical protein K2Y29_15630 [Beijerinckiaceae bacterium]|nr:hypothetical protein [Beijerinckiaceae bacterium]